MITALKAGGAEVLLAGMLAPPNMGPDYAQSFNAIYPDLATKHGLILYPVLSRWDRAQRRFNLNDGLHPNTKGVAEITQSILPKVEQLIERVRTRQAAASKG